MRIGRAAVVTGSALAFTGLTLTLINLRTMRRPASSPDTLSEHVSVLLPMRDEESRAASCIQSVLAQQGVPNIDVIVLDDGSTDATAQIVRSAIADDSRAQLVEGGDSPLPEGWLGKPWACARLVDVAQGSALVFVDADVVLEPHAVAAAVSLLREMETDLISPYPRQLADGALPRLVQPLLQWSWLTTVPLRLSESSPRESLAVANGQFLIVDAAALRRAGGIAAVRGEVLDDVALLRQIKRSGGRGTVVDGTHVATCRMYDTGDELIAGYTKSLWAAFGSPVGAAMAMGALGLAYVLPPVAAVVGRDRSTRIAGAAGFAAAVAGRMVVARATRQRVLPDSLAHPLSIAALAVLTARSWVGRRRGTLTWKGRAVTATEDGA